MIKNAFLKFFGFKRKLSNQDASRRLPVDRVHISTISYVQTENSGARLVDESPILSASSSWSSIYSASELNDDSVVYIPPSSIRYTNSTLKNTIIRMNSNDLDMIADSLLTSPNILPKLQIVSHKGFYYAINNSSLQVYKRLEKRGDLTHVQADLVSLKAIPACIRDSFFAYDESVLESLSDDYGCAQVDSSHTDRTDETYEFDECENCMENEENSICDEVSSTTEVDTKLKSDMIYTKYAMDMNTTDQEIQSLIMNT